MTEDIERLFAEHEQDTVRPLRVDTETVTRGGARRRRRRTGGIVAAAVMAVAILTAGTVTLPGYFGGSADAAQEPAEQPGYPLPELKPLAEGDFYATGIVPDDEGKPSQAADVYGDAYVEWFAEKMDVAFEQWPGMRVYEEQIEYWSAEKQEFVTTEGRWPPRYRIAGASGGGMDGLLSGFSHSFTGDDVYDELSLVVYPRDSYLSGEGEGAQYLQACETRTYRDVTVKRSCTEANGPAGERILRSVTESYSRDDEGGKVVWSNALTVTVFREDGTAVQVRDSVPGVSMDDGTGKFTDETAMDFDDLTDLALAMPGAVVSG